VDTTLRVRPDGRDPVFPIGVLVTADIDVERSEIRLDRPAPAGLEEGSQLHATLTLRDGTGAPSLDDASAVDITVDVIESSTRDGASQGGASASSGAGAGAGTGADTSSAAGSGASRGRVQARDVAGGDGVHSVTITVPTAPIGSELVITVMVAGRHVSGSPLCVRYLPLVHWDASAGVQRVVSTDGCALTTTGPTSANVFRGRTQLLHVDPGQDLKFGLEVTGPTEMYGLTIAIGEVPMLQGTVFEHSSNPGQAFFYSTYSGLGEVNGTAGFPKWSKGDECHVYHFHVRGGVLSNAELTVSCAKKGAPMAPLSSTWTIPSSFYLLVDGYYASTTFRLFLL
jgi:hypothetical protein